MNIPISLSYLWRPYLYVLKAVVVLYYGFNLSWPLIAASHWALAKIIDWNNLQTVLVGIIYILVLHDICFSATTFVIGGFEDKKHSKCLQEERWKQSAPWGYIRCGELTAAELQCALFQISKIPGIWRTIRNSYNAHVIQTMEELLEEQTTETQPKITIDVEAEHGHETQAFARGRRVRAVHHTSKAVVEGTTSKFQEIDIDINPTNRPLRLSASTWCEFRYNEFKFCNQLSWILEWQQRLRGRTEE